MILFWFQILILEDIRNFITNDNITDHLFLFCAGPFGNILTQTLFDHCQENTYIDIGSTLNTFLLGNAGKNRGYLRGEGSLGKICTWSQE